MGPPRVVVIGHPRTGTNSLVEILQCQPGLILVNEPFNEQYPSWDPDNVDYPGRLVAGEPFDDIVDELFALYGGLKELSYQLDDDHLRRLVTRVDVRVVTLSRRNLLDTAVSQVIAETTGLWKTWDADGPLEGHYRDLGPLDIDEVAGRMEWATHEYARIDAAVAGVDHLPLDYEDLYLRGGRGAARLGALWSFLDLPAITSPTIDHFLSPEVRQARPSTYGRVPNLAEIEAALGDDDTGHLDSTLLTAARH
jgi:hypothetical protein